MIASKSNTALKVMTSTVFDVCVCVCAHDKYSV